MDLLDLRQVLLPYVAKRNFTPTPEPDGTAPMQPKTVGIRDDRLRVVPGNRPPNLGLEKLWRNRSPRLREPGRRKRVVWWFSGRLQLRPTDWRARRRPGLQTQVCEDFLDHRLPGHRGPGVRQAQTVLRTVCVRARPTGSRR